MESFWNDNSLIPSSDNIYQAPSVANILKTPIGELIEMNPGLIVFSEGTDIKSRSDESILSGCVETRNPELRTGNLMGVLYVKNENNTQTTKISIASRFDEDSNNQSFLTWMLVHAFDGMIHSWKPRSGMGMWKLLLIFLFKHYFKSSFLL